MSPRNDPSARKGPSERAFLPCAFPPAGTRAGADLAVLLYDGNCDLCRATVRWLFRHEQMPSLRFIPLQAEAGIRALRRVGLPADYRESAVLLEGGGPALKSSAVLEAMRYCRLPWRAAAVLTMLPRAWRDAVYDWVAHHRPSISRLLRVSPPAAAPPAGAWHRFPEWTAGWREGAPPS